MRKPSALRQHERELERLLARHAHDPLIGAILSLELAVRRSARRLLAPSGARAGHSTHP